MSKKRDEDTIEDKEKSLGRDLYASIVHNNGLLEKRTNPTPSKPIIFKVDDRLRKVNQEDYEPKIISIGPIHHEKEQVKSMEEHKVRLLQELLAEREDLSVEMLVETVMETEDEARTCYSISSIFGKEKFLEILLLDGCFIIQLIRNYAFGKYRDPILEPETLIQIVHDLLLFENQLPFFVLTALFDKIKTGNPTDNLCDLILFLVEDIVPWFDDSEAKPLPKPRHVLELVYRCISTKRPSNPNSYGKEITFNPYKLLVNIVKLLPNKITSKLINRWEWKKSWARAKKSPIIHINSVSDLKEIAGIRVKMSPDNILTFAGRVLRLPPLQVSNETGSLLRNVMAYEQLQLGDDDQPRHVIDYIFFLQCLARSTKDVEILRYDGVIKNFLGVDEQIRQMIERLGTNFMRSPYYTYSDVFENLYRYYTFRRHGWMGLLERTYFKNLGSLVKVHVAMLLRVSPCTSLLCF